MNPFAYIAERKIQEAIERGELDDYEGKGKPIQLCDDPLVPPELRMAYKMLKNSGYLPPEAQDLKEVHTILELLQECSDEQIRYRQMNKLNVLMARINKDRRHPIKLEELKEYYSKTVQRISVAERKHVSDIETRRL
ncbi:DUF1992 domain-containing protein [Oleidesulfovibrio sp.]|uniref:DnaJ family domain-containing protein n=1 Tax=Oleidesulfovibrio sp. TaxID=2909707 RepID=UPI003A855D92